MSYNIHLYRKEFKEKQLQSKKDDFFEAEENKVPFTSEQKESLHKRLLSYSYTVEYEKDGQTQFGFKNEEGVEALLTNDCLYFSSTGGGIFEISMTSSEFTDSGEFAKYDPQNGGWELM